LQDSSLQDVVEEIKPLLNTGSDGHLRDLILELLRGSPAIEQLRDELRQLTLTPTESENTRWLANRCLLDIGSDDHRSDLDILISEASNTSLSIAAEIIETLGAETFEQAYLIEFLRICSRLYPAIESDITNKRRSLLPEKVHQRARFSDY
jgi:hypothetical protein